LEHCYYYLIHYKLHTGNASNGSILGPLLFVVFINDIYLAVNMIDLIKKFADDTKLGQKATTAEQRAALPQALDSLTVWATTWGMQFNIAKCKVMHLGIGNARQDYTMEGQVLTKTEVERDVGVMVSDSLKPAAQCAKAAKPASGVLAQILRTFHYRDSHVFIRLYKQYVLPHLEFSVVAWAPWTQADKAVIEKVQERAITAVTGLQGRSYEERLRELGMLTLEERRHQMDMEQVHKILHGHDMVCSSQWFRLSAENGALT